MLNNIYDETINFIHHPIAIQVTSYLSLVIAAEMAIRIPFDIHALYKNRLEQQQLEQQQDPSIRSKLKDSLAKDIAGTLFFGLCGLSDILYMSYIGVVFFIIYSLSGAEYKIAEAIRNTFKWVFTTLLNIIKKFGITLVQGAVQFVSVARKALSITIKSIGKVLVETGFFLFLTVSKILVSIVHFFIDLTKALVAIVSAHPIGLAGSLGFVYSIYTYFLPLFFDA